MALSLASPTHPYGWFPWTSPEFSTAFAHPIPSSIHQADPYSSTKFSWIVTFCMESLRPLLKAEWRLFPLCSPSTLLIFSSGTNSTLKLLFVSISLTFVSLHFTHLSRSSKAHCLAGEVAAQQMFLEWTNGHDPYKCFPRKKKSKEIPWGTQNKNTYYFVFYRFMSCFLSLEIIMTNIWALARCITVLKSKATIWNREFYCFIFQLNKWKLRKI